MSKSPVKRGKYLIDVGLDDQATVRFIEELVSPVEKRLVSGDGKILLEDKNAALLAELARDPKKVYPN
ncbi:hypothetical protein [Shinella sp. G-2]|uniref:hypothetical protein n=1 Tax=Shinella sp. G-2 TaxID=3133141 RepID=UPI003D0257C7